MKIHSMPTTVTKEDIVRTVSELPEDATLDDAFEKMFILHKIERGLKDKDDGKTLTQEEVETHFRQRRTTNQQK